jgi:integrase
LGEQTALDLLAAALRDDSIHASDKVAALCVLYFGQPVARIVELRIADIGVAADGASIQFSEDPLPLPEVIAPVFLAAIDDRRSSRGVNGGSPWLFPSTRAGQHVSHEAMLKRLRMIGIEVQAVHNDVLDGLLRAAPPALLARALGYSATTLEARELRAGHGYASYAADIARRSRQTERRGRGR